MRMRRLLSILFFSLFCTTLSLSTGMAQTPGAPLTNQDIVALAAAGLPDDVIVAKIHQAHSVRFDTSVTALTDLKKAGVSGAVIRVMIDPAAAVATTQPPAPAGPNPDDPTAVHSPGIYMMAKGGDGQMHLTKLEHTVPKAGKTSGILAHAFTYGIAKAHYQVILDGPKAALEVPDTNPTFYAYIPEDNTTFGGSSVTIKDFALVKFDVKDNTRIVNTATVGFASVSNGTDSKSRQGFNSELVKPGIYKLTLTSPLPVGEYAFQQSGATTGSSSQQNAGSFFDFGILSNI